MCIHGRRDECQQLIGVRSDRTLRDTGPARALVILRETLAYHSPLADFAFAMQGLGSGAITLAGTAAQQARYLSAVATGEKIAAFALSEPDAGSDVAAMAPRPNARTCARCRPA